MGGFATPNNGGFAVVFADGSVRPAPYGDAFSLRLNGLMMGGAALPGGGGYWEVGSDGGVFGFGAARFYGSMASVRMNQPVIAMAATKTGRGYWLVGRDGGIFAFGDARFYGSAGGFALQQPIVGIAVSPTGKGYRLVAGDGGVFDFGDAAFHGSLPGRHVQVGDVRAIGSTPTGNGYWIAREQGRVYAFGDAQALGNATMPCDGTTAIIANPASPGYRIVGTSGQTVAFGTAPGGSQPTGAPRHCSGVHARIELPTSTLVAGGSMTANLIVDNETQGQFRAAVTGQCQPEWAIGLGNAKIPNPPVIPATCMLSPLVFPRGPTQWATKIYARSTTTGAALPPGTYYARLYYFPGIPATTPVAVHVTAPGP